MAKKSAAPSKQTFIQPSPGWYRLDNAAKIYPATMQRDWNSIYRVSATLDEEIMSDILSTVVKDLEPRFPTFYVQLRKGFFWYYFEPVGCTDIVEEESSYPCCPIPVGYGTKPVFRVLYYKNRLSLEIFHAVTDGFGAMTFLKAIVCRYLFLRGNDMEDARWVVADLRDDPIASETEDSFLKYYQDVQKISRMEPLAYSYKARRSDNDQYLRTISGSFSVEAAKKLAKENGVTITQYLTALYILSFAGYISRSAHKQPVRISVPVNLRKYFRSETLRNFSLYANVGLPVTPDISIEEIIAVIVPQMSEGLESSRLLRTFSQNVRAERVFALRIAPLFVKNFILKIVCKFWGENRYTSPFSNLGQIDLPPSMSSHVREMGAVLGVSPTNAISATSVSYGDRMTVCFSSGSPESCIQAFFFQYLTKKGIDVEVESNV